MAASVSLATIRTRAQSLADMVNSNFVSTAEWGYWINAGTNDLYDKLCQADPERYCISFSITTVANTSDYALPSDFNKLLRVDALYGNSVPQLYYVVRKFSLLEEDAYQFPVYVNLAGPAYRYRLRQGNIHFTPAPQTAVTMRLWYAQNMPALVNDTDTFDFVSGWEEYVVLFAAIRALQKEGATDVTGFKEDMARYDLKIKQLELERDSSFPEQTVDVMRGPFPFRGWPGGNGPL